MIALLLSGLAGPLSVGCAAYTSPETSPAGASPAATTASVRSVGQVRVVSGPSPCESQGQDPVADDGVACYQIDVSCPEVAETQGALLKVGAPAGTPLRGTILFMTGGGGTGLWERFGDDARRVLDQLRESGFRSVQLAWSRGWLVGAAGRSEGHVRLACRPATVARWVYETLHDRGSDTALCATGNSGGSAQTSYMLSHYGLSDIIAAALPTGGPPMGRIDLGCVRDDPANSGLWYEAGSAALIDQGFGFLQGGTGPCARQDASFRSAFRDASVAIGGQYVYPKTMVWFLYGENDGTNAVEQGEAYYQTLVAAGSPLVRREAVPRTPHATPSTREGANRIRDILLAECRPR